MYLLLNRMNTKNLCIILKPFKSKIQYNISPISCSLTGSKSFHLSHTRSDNDNEKQKEKLDEAKKKRAELAKFSFVQIKEDAPKIKHVTEVKLPEPNLNDHQKIKVELKPELKKSSHIEQVLTQPMSKGMKSSVWSKKKTYSSKYEIDPKVAQRLAKMIDPKNTEKTAELLTEPLQHSRKNKAASKSPKTTNEDAFNLRSILEEIKKEKASRPHNDFKSLMTSQIDNYSTLNAETVPNHRDNLNRGNKREFNQFNSNIKNQSDSQHQDVYSSRVSYLKRFVSDKNVVVYKGQMGDKFQMRHNLNSGEGLSMFTDNMSSVNSTVSVTRESPIWTMHYNEVLDEADIIPPINGFEEMIQLTNDGKLWNFPIDNEQGIDEEDADVPFQEHVFLDNYLEDFPDIEPIQEFMTLVLNGISKNSYLTLDEKKSIVEWYKEYFLEKEGLIKEALEAERAESEYLNKQSENLNINN